MGIGRLAPRLIARLVPKPTAILSAGADRRLGRQSRDPADCLSAYFTGLSAALVLTPRAFRTGVLTLSTPHSNQPLCIAAAVINRPAMQLFPRLSVGAGSLGRVLGLWTVCLGSGFGCGFEECIHRLERDS